jgi:ubiquinone/menaquinone biosynthesis C-methylase UbiE
MINYDDKKFFLEHQKDVSEMVVRFANHEINFDLTNSNVLDVGGGGGIQAGCLAQNALRVICMDISDNQVRYGGEFVKLLAQKFLRNEFTLPIERVEFHVGDAMSMIYKDAQFDFISSFNVFEHIPDPARAFSECARVLKSGGYIYLTFAPIWTADSGSHFHHRVIEPWSHLILSDEEFIAKMRTAGADDAEVFDFTYAMNRMNLNYYLSLFDDVKKFGLTKLAHVKWEGFYSPNNEHHPNFNTCLSNGYSTETLKTNGMYLILQKI